LYRPGAAGQRSPCRIGWRWISCDRARGLLPGPPQGADLDGARHRGRRLPLRGRRSGRRETRAIRQPRIGEKVTLHIDAPAGTTWDLQVNGSPLRRPGQLPRGKAGATADSAALLSAISGS